MLCKALDLADALLVKMCSTTSIAMDWLRNQQRQRQLRHQFRHLLLCKHQHPHQLRHQLQPLLLHRDLQLHRVIVNK